MKTYLLVLMTAEDRVVRKHRLFFSFSLYKDRIDLVSVLFVFVSVLALLNYVFIFLSLVLKVFKVLEFFSSMGNEFQVETTRLLKKIFLISVLLPEVIKFMAYAVLLIQHFHRPL